MRFARSLASIAAAAAAASCGGDPGIGPPDDRPTVVFVFRLHGQPATEELRVASSSPDFIAQARAQLQLPQAQRRLFAIGPIAAGRGGHNVGWSWHFTDVSLAEAAVEVCDGTPSMVQADLSYWLNTVKSFCPWGSYVFAEVR